MRYLRSKKLTILLIITLTLVSLLGVATSSKVFHSKWFIALGVVFFINLSACTTDQLIRLKKLYGISIKSQRNYLNKLGNCLFHIGLMVIVISGLISLGFKMSGYLELTEGESVAENHDSYVVIDEGPYFNDDHLGFQITLEKQNRFFKENKLDYISSQVKISDEGITANYETDRGHPFEHNGVTFYYQKSGFSPNLVVTDSNNQRILDGYVAFESVWEDDHGEYKFKLPIANERIMELYFYPSPIKDTQKINLENIKLTDPLIKTKILFQGKVEAQALIKAGQGANLKGYGIQMKDVRYWSGFEVVRDPGAKWIFAGFWICLFGLAMSFWYSPNWFRREQTHGS